MKVFDLSSAQLDYCYGEVMWQEVHSPEGFGVAIYKKEELLATSAGTTHNRASP